METILTAWSFSVYRNAAGACMCIDRDLIYDPVESTEMPYPIIRRGFAVCMCMCVYGTYV